MGTGMGRRNRKRQGMALLLALIAVLLISALVGGIMMLGVSHLALSGANSSYANALSLAEAGVNWELSARFAALPAPRMLQVLQALQADGLARRLRLLQAAGVLP